MPAVFGRTGGRGMSFLVTIFDGLGGDYRSLMGGEMCSHSVNVQLCSALPCFALDALAIKSSSTVSKRISAAQADSRRGLSLRK
jgi:hypothetical protein